MSTTTPLIEITEQTHGILVCMVYAGPHNLTGKPVYESDECFLHQEAEVRLRKAADIASLSGLRLKIFDAYRHPKAQEIFWNFLPDPRYFADAAQGSNHSRGVAVDLTLVDEHGQELDMGTSFDTMMELSHHFHPGLRMEAQRNRLWLLAIMTQAGFRKFDSEWWHYELPDAHKYPLISRNTSV